MPYIKQEIREFLDPEIDALVARIRGGFLEDGNINYVITRLMLELYGKGGYAMFNRAMGVLDCVAREFYRRRVAVYEDKKIIENGDVY